MAFSIVDFLTGFLLMNAMPHFLFGILNVRFLCVFGFSPRANIAYGLASVVVALALFHFRYGIQAVADHAAIAGALTMLSIYLATGRFFVRLFDKDAVRSRQRPT